MPDDVKDQVKPLTDAAAPAGPPAPITEVELDGQKFTTDQLRRHKQQATEANRLAQGGWMGQISRWEKVGLSPAEIQKRLDAVEAFNAAHSAGEVPKGKGEEDLDVMTEEDLETFVEDRAERKMRQRETQAGFRVESQACREALEEVGIPATDPDAELHFAALRQLLSSGWKDEKGNPVPGTAHVDEKGHPIPATVKEAKAAVQKYIKMLASRGAKLRQNQVGKPPLAPMQTGTGEAGVPGNERKANMFALDQEEQIAEARRRLELRHANRSGTTASAIP
jgi:DNA-binding transcriptional MerR regulator